MSTTFKAMYQRKFKDQWAEKKALESSKKSRKKLLKLQKMSKKSKKDSRTFEHFFINSRTFKAFNFCFQIQGLSRIFKFCTNPVLNYTLLNQLLLLKIGVKIEKFTSNHKKKYFHLEDELK